LSYSGELGYELHMPMETLRVTYLVLHELGRDLGLTDVGYRALDGLGLEMGYGSLGVDLTREYSPVEAGLDRLVRPAKGPFVGRDALLDRFSKRPSQRRVWLLFDPNSDAQPNGMEPVSQAGKLVGSTVRGGYGHRLGRAIAVAYLPHEVILEGNGLTVGILGEEWPVSMSFGPPYEVGQH
jgi:dimethylglycine dehydrogenase